MIYFYTNVRKTKIEKLHTNAGRTLVIQHTNASKRYAVQRIAILANECPEPKEWRNCLSATLTNTEESVSLARVLRRFVLVPHEICVRQLASANLSGTTLSSSDWRENFSERNGISLAMLLRITSLQIASAKYSRTTSLSSDWRENFSERNGISLATQLLITNHWSLNTNYLHSSERA